MRPQRLLGRRSLSVLGLLLPTLGAASARAGDVGKLAGEPLRIDVTATSFFNWHSDNRNRTPPYPFDDNYGEQINHWNFVFGWNAFQAGLRLDTWTYVHTAKDPATYPTTSAQNDVAGLAPYRYRNTYLTPIGNAPPNTSPGVLPSKFFVTYNKPFLEATFGDAYAAFGRGFVLNIRKIDEIGADTTLQGGKVVVRVSPVTLTLVGGLTNPVRVDDATGIALVNQAPTGSTEEDPRYWARDLVLGGRLEAKLGTATLGVHGSDIRRTLDVDATNVKEVRAYGASVAIPRVSDALPLNVYLEGALQQRLAFLGRDDGLPKDADRSGYAAYGALSLTKGILTTTLEGKHYRAFEPVKLNARFDKFAPFQAVQYNATPTVELITQDSLTYNTCTTGGRARFDVKAQKGFGFHWAGGYFKNWNTDCTSDGSFSVTAPDDKASTILDFFGGFELRSTTDASYLLITAGTRRENLSSGAPYYFEGWVQIAGAKALEHGLSAEIDAWHRNRARNGIAWREGQTYLSFKHGSDWAGILGHEYTSEPANVLSGAALVWSNVQHYLSVGGQLKFSNALTLRVFAGQQRSALKCINGVCRIFPAFEGVKTEFIFRY
ncbi:MAG: hypothetical protein IPJ34_31100 [Myxococcales bacterium]|nr:hypothetical protein [Myxococcales bacterium]